MEGNLDLYLHGEIYPCLTVLIIDQKKKKKEGKRENVPKWNLFPGNTPIYTCPWCHRPLHCKLTNSLLLSKLSSDRHLLLSPERFQEHFSFWALRSHIALSL